MNTMTTNPDSNIKSTTFDSNIQTNFDDYQFDTKVTDADFQNSGSQYLTTIPDVKFESSNTNQDDDTFENSESTFGTSVPGSDYETTFEDNQEFESASTAMQDSFSQSTFAPTGKLFAKTKFFNVLNLGLKNTQ